MVSNARQAGASRPLPVHRPLRGYAFDPSLASRLETALVSQVTYRVRWENNLRPGPIGDYVEVVDVDPASGCIYAPVDLDDPHVLALQGLAPSEGDPQFHQQMVYAAAMTTIERFERALGRQAFWRDRIDTSKTGPERYNYVGALRIYPHALRQANAYYSPAHVALLFGYFPATEDRRSGQYPGGLVFTCLSHDVVAHETTHALLDGFHAHFMDATNREVLAFHEAFADIVALFQHFGFPEVLAHQIARTGGDLRTENLLAQLATQFGLARGMHGALRDAIGGVDKDSGRWTQRVPDPTEIDRTSEVHALGAILVAAVFDAFLSIYAARTADLMRIATGGSGVLPAGALHPDLVMRLAQEASKVATHVLTMCIRALDYCPPVDLTFGAYLRALITADLDLVPDDEHSYRLAFVEAFRRRGIYPRNVRTLSAESLRWERPDEDPMLRDQDVEGRLQRFLTDIGLRQFVDQLRYIRGRREIWEFTRQVRASMHTRIRDAVGKAELLQQLTGLAFGGGNLPPTVRVNRSGEPVFEVHALREARRLRSDGSVLNQVFLTILQHEIVEVDGRSFTLRCGSTLVIDLDELRVRYVVRKGLQDRERIQRTLDYMQRHSAPDAARAVYFGATQEPFAALHLAGH